MNERESQIQDLMEAYRAAVLGKDVDALLGLYDADVRVFDLWNEWVFEGATAWRVNVAAWFGSLGDERVQVGVEDVRIRESGDLAIVDAIVSYTGLAPDGSSLRTMHNRLTWALEDRDGAWRITHEHTSAPVSDATSTVILQR